MIFVVACNHKIVGLRAGSIRIGEHYLGLEIATVIRSRGVAAKQGFLMYYSKGDAIRTKVSVRYRRSGRLSEVVVKRGSTVYRSWRQTSDTDLEIRPPLLLACASSVESRLTRKPM